jgi:hypothetical protein
MSPPFLFRPLLSKLNNLLFIAPLKSPEGILEIEDPKSTNNDNNPLRTIFTIFIPLKLLLIILQLPGPF